MAAAAKADKPHRRFWRRRGFWLLVIVLSIPGIPTGYFFFRQLWASWDLASAVAEVDEIDPGWRLADIEAARVKPADEKNSAMMVLKVRGALPRVWGKVDLYTELRDVLPPFMLTPSQHAALRDELRPHGVAIALARQLANMEALGHYGISYRPNTIATLVEDQRSSGDVAKLLQLALWNAIQEGRGDEALESCRALLNVARSIGDDPAWWCQLMRIAGQRHTIECLERVLAQGTAEGPSLAKMQQALLDEAAETLSLVALRGERALLDAYFTNLAAKKQPVAYLDHSKDGSVWDELPDFFLMARIRHSHAWMLRYSTKAVEAAKLKGPQRLETIQNLRAEVKKFEDNIRNYRSIQFGIAAVRFQTAKLVAGADTYLHCAAGGLAAERFRIDNQRWPKSLEELVDKKYLGEMPIDVYDGQPLRFRPTADGVVIYSIGPKKDYDGTALDDLTKYDPKRTRIEFRLWDPDRRRQQPASITK